MSDGVCNHCGAPYPKDRNKVTCEYCGAEIEERIKALTTFPTILPLQQIDTTKNPDFVTTEEQAQSSGWAEKIIYFAIAIFIMGVILPPAVSGIMSSAFTSVNPNISTEFTYIVPVIAIGSAICLGLLGFRRENKNAKNNQAIEADSN